MAGKCQFNILSIIEEHKHVRSSVGLFDVSHMGDILIQGRDAASFKSYLYLVIFFCMFSTDLHISTEMGK